MLMSNCNFPKPLDISNCDHFVPMLTKIIFILMQAISIYSKQYQKAPISNWFENNISRY